MMRSQTSMDQLVELSQHRHKGKVGLGYTKQGESSLQGAQNNRRPTCNHCGKEGHTSKKIGAMESQSLMKNVTIVTSMDIEKVNAQRKLSLKENVLHATNKVINLQSAETRIGILLNNLLKQYLVGITTLGVDVIYVESMDTLEVIA